MKFVILNAFYFNESSKRERTTSIVMKTIVFLLNICEALVGQTKLVNLIFEGDENRITVKLGYNVQPRTGKIYSLKPGCVLALYFKYINSKYYL